MEEKQRPSLFSFAQNIGLGNALIFLLAVIGYLFTAPPATVSTFSQRVRLIVADIDAAIPAAFFLTFLLDVGGSLLMLFWNLMKRQIERYDAKITADAKAEGLEQGLEQGRTEAYQEIAAWNSRRLDAEAKGIPFNEPPPSQNGN